MMNATQDLKALVTKAKAYVDQQRKANPKAHVFTQHPLKSVQLAEETSVFVSTAQDKAQPPAEAHPKQPWGSSLDAFRAQICGCLNCGLGNSRKRFLFGSGNPKASLVFFGLAPQTEEEAAGQIFVGEAGALLNKMLSAMGLSREKVYLMNALKCSLPHGRHEAQSKELEACRPYFEHQLRLISPKVVCAFGPEATAALLGPEADFGRVRGKFIESNGWLVMPTYHPAELLRHESLKRQAWEDLKALLKKIS